MFGVFLYTLKLKDIDVTVSYIMYIGTYFLASGRSKDLKEVKLFCKFKFASEKSLPLYLQFIRKTLIV